MDGRLGIYKTKRERPFYFWVTLVVYTPTEGIKLFGQNKEFDNPDPIYIESGCYEEVEERPDYWFMEAPARIETESHWIISLFESMFNIGTTKWSVIPYTLEND